MTVKDLIEILSEFHGDQPVFIPKPTNPRHAVVSIGDVIELKGGGVKLCLADSKSEEVGGEV